MKLATVCWVRSLNHYPLQSPQRPVSCVPSFSSKESWGLEKEADHLAEGDRVSSGSFDCVRNATQTSSRNREESVVSGRLQAHLHPGAQRYVPSALSLPPVLGSFAVVALIFSRGLSLYRQSRCVHFLAYVAWSASLPRKRKPLVFNSTSRSPDPPLEQGH